MWIFVILNLDNTGMSSYKSLNKVKCNNCYSVSNKCMELNGSFIIEQKILNRNN